MAAIGVERCFVVVRAYRIDSDDASGWFEMIEACNLNYVRVRRSNHCAMVAQPCHLGEEMDPGSAKSRDKADSDD